LRLALKHAFFAEIREFLAAVLKVVAYHIIFIFKTDELFIGGTPSLAYARSSRSVRWWLLRPKLSLATSARSSPRVKARTRFRRAVRSQQAALRRGSSTTIHHGMCGESV
jgi:hypothetical protein